MPSQPLSDLSDLELEELAEAVAREQRARETAVLRAIPNQRAFFLPARLYAGTR